MQKKKKKENSTIGNNLRDGKLDCTLEGRKQKYEKANRTEHKVHKSLKRKAITPSDESTELLF